MFVCKWVDLISGEILPREQKLFVVKKVMMKMRQKELPSH